MLRPRKKCFLMLLLIELCQPYRFSVGYIFSAVLLPLSISAGQIPSLIPSFIGGFGIPLDIGGGLGNLWGLFLLLFTNGQGFGFRCFIKHGITAVLNHFCNRWHPYLSSIHSAPGRTADQPFKSSSAPELFSLLFQIVLMSSGCHH